MRQKNTTKIGAYVMPVLIVLVVGVFISASVVQSAGARKEARSPNAKHLRDFHTQKLDFTRHYFLTHTDMTFKTAQYDLPLKVDQITNFADFSKKISLADDALGLLEKNGFVIITNPFNPKEEYITKPYSILKRRGIPIFITSDSLLHLYHIQFDETLREIEEREFYDKIWEISRELLADSIEKYGGASGDLKEASKRSVAYFSVGLSLLVPKPEQVARGEAKSRYIDAYFKTEDLGKYGFEVPPFVKSYVEKEIDLINEHSGFRYSPIFKYKEDYSQYVPRGHYTRSERLKNYFRALMWYGRMSLLLKGGCNDCLVSQEEARIQSVAAALIASRFGQSPELKKKWDRIYSVTAFYVGLSDDLGPNEYLEALDSVFGGLFDIRSLTGETIEKLKAKLAEYRAPRIYGGTGDCILTPPYSPEQADQCLEKTKGFRLMGQRFIPDSYVFSRLVGPRTDVYQGDKKRPFTLVVSRAGRPIRGFPRGLDAMALLGSKRARELLDELDDSDYKKYHSAYDRLEEEFNSCDEKAWNRNLYWSWLFALKPLLKEHGSGHPTFMQTRAWQDKQLSTALASWTELRHDTILYAKQSYTMANAAIASRPEKPVVGYIEAVPEFYNRLLALTRMTTKGLQEMDVLNNSSKSRLESLERVIKRLVEISEKELRNEELTKEDYRFIRSFGDRLNTIIAEVDEKAKKTTMIADVHTDANTGQVLEEALGYVNLIVVAYKLPDGRLLVGAGPVTSYYEFKQPMGDRLTDEKWRDILASNPPERPPWISNFAR